MESFGRYLIQQRELRGMSRDDVVRATRLSTGSVDALEGDHPEKLPARVFVLGYIRTYAGSIGLSPDDALLRYEEWAQTRREADGFTPGPQQTLPKRERGRRRELVLAAVGVGLALLVYLAWRFG